MTTKMTVADWSVAAAVNSTRSVLAEDLEIYGDVTSIGPIDVLGKITGSVRAPDILVATFGRVDGQVSALDLSVLGTIDGSVIAKTVKLAESARVQADILYDLITIEIGAQLEGSLRRKR